MAKNIRKICNEMNQTLTFFWNLMFLSCFKVKKTHMQSKILADKQRSHITLSNILRATLVGRQSSDIRLTAAEVPHTFHNASHLLLK